MTGLPPITGPIDQAIGRRRDLVSLLPSQTPRYIAEWIQREGERFRRLRVSEAPPHSCSALRRSPDGGTIAPINASRMLISPHTYQQVRDSQGDQRAGAFGILPAIGWNVSPDTVHHRRKMLLVHQVGSVRVGEVVR